MDGLRRTLTAAPGLRLDELRTALAMFTAKAWTVALAGGLATLLVIGAVAALFDNPIFGRQLEPRPQDYVLWAITAILGGLVIGTFALTPRWSDEGKAVSGGFLSTLAVGCPICNKVAVALLGTSGALNVFGPTQIFIGVASSFLLAWTLLLRAQAVVGGCPAGGADASPGGRRRALVDN